MHKELLNHGLIIRSVSGRENCKNLPSLIQNLIIFEKEKPVNVISI